MQVDGRADLVHGFAVQADEEREGVAVLLDADALSLGAGRYLRGPAAVNAAGPDSETLP